MLSREAPMTVVFERVTNMQDFDGAALILRPVIDQEGSME
jgi:hypothetical protein